MQRLERVRAWRKLHRLPCATDGARDWRHGGPAALRCMRSRCEGGRDEELPCGPMAAKLDWFQVPGKPEPTIYPQVGARLICRSCLRAHEPAAGRKQPVSGGGQWWRVAVVAGCGGGPWFSGIHAVTTGGRARVLSGAERRPTQLPS